MLKALLVNALLLGASYAASSSCSLDVSIAPKSGSDAKWPENGYTKTMHTVTVHNNGPCGLTDVLVDIVIPNGCFNSSSWNLIATTSGSHKTIRVTGFGGELAANKDYTGAGIVVACTSPLTPKLSISVYSSTCKGCTTTASTPTTKPTPAPTPKPDPKINLSFVSVSFSSYNGSFGFTVADTQPQALQTATAQCVQTQKGVGCQSVYLQEFGCGQTCIAFAKSSYTGSKNPANSYFFGVGALSTTDLFVLNVAVQDPLNGVMPIPPTVAETALLPLAQQRAMAQCGCFASKFPGTTCQIIKSECFDSESSDLL